MESFSWAPAHCVALREFVTKGMSFAEAAIAINKEFGTEYTRSAAIGRARRMGLLARAKQRNVGPRHLAKSKAPRPPRSRQQPEGGLTPSASSPERVNAVKLRCVGITPRLVALVDLETGDCRYPYGGDKEGEAITFCGHPRFPGSSYCRPHYHLTRDDGTPSDRIVTPFMLRLVAAA